MRPPFGVTISARLCPPRRVQPLPKLCEQIAAPLTPAGAVRAHRHLRSVERPVAL